MKGRLITFEGTDGCGKTTQSKKLKNYLARKGYPVMLLREPGGEKIAERIRKILLDYKNSKVTPLTELLLYNASRAQLVQQVITPALKRGKIVICDRFYDSTLAYQGYGRNLNKKMINYLNKISTKGVVPNLTILIDLSPVIALKRKGKKKVAKDRLERENLNFHKRVRNGYLKIASLNKKRFRVVDASGDIKHTWLAVKTVIDDFLKKGR